MQAGVNHAPWRGRALIPLAISAVLGLAGCGGGGSSGGTGPETTGDEQAQSDASSLVGTYVSDCFESSEVRTAAAGNVRQINHLIVVEDAPDRLVFSTVETYFAPADIACTGVQIGEAVSEGSDNVWQLDGMKEANFDSTVVSARRLSGTMGRVDRISVGSITLEGTTLSGGGTLTLNDIEFPANYFSDDPEVRAIVYLDNGGALYFGDGAVGRDGYPDTLSATFPLRRQ